MYEYLYRFVRTRSTLFILLLFFASNLNAQYKVEVLNSKDFSIFGSNLIYHSSSGDNFVVSDIRANQLNLYGFVPPRLLAAEAILIFIYSSVVPYYLTIGAERPGVGFTYVTQNLYAMATLAAAYNIIAIRFSLAQLGIINGMQWPPSQLLRIYLHYSQQPLPAPGPSFYQYDLAVTQLDDDGSNEYGDNPGGKEPPITEGDPPPNLGSPISSMTHIGCSMPNIDLDNSTHPAGSGYAGDKNACGPAAASNSLMWLAQSFPGISIPFSHRALIDSLSKYMGRAPSSGVNIETFIQGKLNFIKAHNLPIQIKFQSQGTTGDIIASGGTYAKNQNTGSYPTWDFLKSEVADSEDVEIFYRWFDGDQWRGHVAAVTGVYETSNGKKTIGIKHDITQKDTGGTVQEYPEITVDGFGRMILHRHGTKRYVSHVVSESPGQPFVTSIQPGDELNPTVFYLNQNYPNPFNPSTKISWQSPVGTHQTLKVYDVLGNEVVTLVNEYKPAGRLEVEFDARGLSSGVYFYKLQTDTFTKTQKMILLR